MRAVRRVRWLICGLLLANPLGAQVNPQLVLPAALLAVPGALESNPVYLRLESGTWAVGGIDDLTDSERALTLMPERCVQNLAVVEVGVGFVVEGELTELDVAGAVKASEMLGIGIHFKNQLTGKCDLFRFVEGGDGHFLLENVAVDSAIYRNRLTLEVELCLEVRSLCYPPPTGKDAVSVQDLTIGGKGSGP